MAIVAYADPVSTTLENQIQTKGTALQGDVYVFAQPKVRMRDYVIDTRFAPDGTSGLFNFGVIVKSHLLNPKQVTVYYDLYGPDSTLVRSGKRDARFEMRLEDTVRFSKTSRTSNRGATKARNSTPLRYASSMKAALPTTPR